jgi:hypothetical protein
MQELSQSIHFFRLQTVYFAPWAKEVRQVESLHASRQQISAVQPASHYSAAIAGMKYSSFGQ